jgi:hypothetical protein
MRTVLLALLLAMPAAAQTDVLVVSGLGGEPRYQETFLATGLAVVAAAEGRLGVEAARVRYLAEDPGRNRRINGRSTKEEIANALRALADVAEPTAVILIVLIGHGAASSEGARINLPGPDLSADQFAILLAPLRTQQVIVVNAASASGDWARVLAGPGRVVLTATRSSIEREETQFGRHFADALGSDDADRDKDGRLSVLEAFEYARREVERAYERDQRLRTEHPLLEADGDGVGTLEPVLTDGDGAAAAVLFLGNRAGAAPLTGLAAVRDSLEREVLRLRGSKASMTQEAYDRRLESLLLELARVSRALREQEGRKP